MKSVLVWLAAMTTIFHRSQAQCSDGGEVEVGDIRVTGIHTTNLVAGRMEICTSGGWRAVCHHNWDISDTMVVCRQLGFPIAGALPCQNSCFGKNRTQMGLYDFGCNGQETKLHDCITTARVINACVEQSGVICTNRTTATLPNIDMSSESCATATIPPTTMDDVTPAHTSTTPTSTEEGMGAELMESCSCQSLGGGLGGLSAILAILLVGVVMGWVRSCHRKRGGKGLQERAMTSDNETESKEKSSYTPGDNCSEPEDTFPYTVTSHNHSEPEETFPNPSYAFTSLPHNHCPSIHYETVGHKDTPGPTDAMDNLLPSHDNI